MQFDPLITSSFPTHQTIESPYWRSTLESSDVMPSLKSPQQPLPIDTDILIIGGGFSGLSTAYHLAQHTKKTSGYSHKMTLIEGNTLGWGASSRNAGFALPSTGRLGYSALCKKYGDQAAKDIKAEYDAGVEQIRALGKKHNIDQQEDGYLKIAHNKAAFNELQKQAEFLTTRQFADIDVLTQTELTTDFTEHAEAQGAIRYHNGFGLNPLKLVQAYVAELIASDISIHENCAAHAIQRDKDAWRVTTNQGTIRANQIAITTNGYTVQSLFPAFSKRILPVQTSIIVTEPLTGEALDAIKTHQVMMDTRCLKYYYRRLPDNRLLFGGRGAISGKHAANPVYFQRLYTAMLNSFPALKHVKTAYTWGGWISVSLDDIPHIHELEKDIYYASGYCGAGVSFTSQAGKRLAQAMLGHDPLPDIPLYQSPLKPFPFAKFRRVGQWMYYQWGLLKDNL